MVLGARPTRPLVHVLNSNGLAGHSPIRTVLTLDRPNEEVDNGSLRLKQAKAHCGEDAIPEFSLSPPAGGTVAYWRTSLEPRPPFDLSSSQLGQSALEECSPRMRKAAR